MKLNLINKVNTDIDQVFIAESVDQLPADIISAEELKYISKQKENERDLAILNRLGHHVFVVFYDKPKTEQKKKEFLRKKACDVQKMLNELKCIQVQLASFPDNKELLLAFAEGLALSNYQFLKYFTKADKKRNSLNDIEVVSEIATAADLEELNNVCDANGICRTLVNEPIAYLSAPKLSEEIQNLFKETNAKVEVFNKKKIESLKMGGLLAVNKGSIDPPTFNIIEWKPENAINKKPYILVGKGVVYDTGGLNIKIEDYMNNMKCDMAGAAAVVGSMHAAVSNELPLYVIGLIPATDNRPNGNAYANGDILTMYDGTTVEVINTDAEGRLILADALAYAKQYDPELVIDMATLTGSAERAIGSYGSVAMGQKSESYMSELKAAGDEVYERLAELPFWDEYNDDLKSTIADIKHLGSPLGGAISAGKFLAHFTDYPYIHLDIAGTAFATKEDSYRGVGGTGVGVRLIYAYLKQILTD
ncbi:MAG: peptidase M17 [Bacteroidetes bacterium]|nr:peptidase M17 [Bacteroidota bacterium]